MQQKLGLNADGIFGGGTEQAVKNFQTKNGLSPDGIVGEQTWQKIMGQGALITEPAPVAVQPAPQPVAQPVASVGGLKLENLKGHIPDAVLAQIPDTAAKFNITNNLRLAHFLSQCGHESGGFKAVSENLNYSADGLKKIFGKYFPGNLNESYARQPEKIASRVYGNRMGNGDEASGEGYKFRGRGYIQITSRPNYKNLVNYVLSYSGSDSSVLSIQSSWKTFGKNLDTVLTCSSNNDWDELFLNKNYSLALWAVGNYLINHYKLFP